MCMAMRKRPIEDFPKSQRKTMLVRAVVGQASFGFFMLSLSMNPLIIQMVIWQTNPFWAAILGFFVNKEPVMCIEYIAMVICLVGVVLIAFSKNQYMNSVTDDQSQLEQQESTANQFLGISVIFGVSWLFAASNVINRKLKGLHFAIILFYHALCGISIAISIILLEKLMTGNPFRIYSAQQYGIMMLCCCFDFLNTNAQTLAFQNDSSGFVSLIGYVGILYAFLTDYLIFKLQLSPLAIIGASVILIPTLTVSYFKIREGNRVKRLEQQINNKEAFQKC